MKIIGDKGRKRKRGWKIEIVELNRQNESERWVNSEIDDDSK